MELLECQSNSIRISEEGPTNTWRWKVRFFSPGEYTMWFILNKWFFSTGEYTMWFILNKWFFSPGEYTMWFILNKWCIRTLLPCTACPSTRARWGEGGWGEGRWGEVGCGGVRWIPGLSPHELLQFLSRTKAWPSRHRQQNQGMTITAHPPGPAVLG